MKKKRPYSDSSGAWEYWFSKRARLRHIASFWTTVLIILGMQLATPSYSLSTVVTGHLYLQFDLNAFFDLIRSAALFVNGPILDEDGFDGESIFKIKLFIFAAIFWMINAFYKSHDALSDPVYIRNSIKMDSITKPKFPFNLLDEVYLYPKLAASNLLYKQKCISCGSECVNRLGINSEKKTDLWRKIFGSLKISHVELNLMAFHRCYKLYILRSIIILSAASILPIYTLVRVTEYAFGIPVVFYTPWLACYFLILVLSVFLIKMYFSIHKSDAKGFWAQYKESVDVIFRSDLFSDVYELEVCAPFSYTLCGPQNNNHKNNEYSFYTKELTTIFLLIDSLNTIVDRKLDFVVENDISESNKHLIAMQKLVCSVNKFYKFIYDNEFTINTFLFVPGRNDEYLSPRISVPYYKEFMDRGDEFCKKNFSKNSSSIVSQAWDMKKLQTRNIGIPLLDRGEKASKTVNSCKSIIAIPIILDSIQSKKMMASEIIGDATIGVLCITSDSEVPFSSANSQMNAVILDAFTVRIRYEYTRYIMMEMEA